jgi:hypothetical protein
VKGIIMSAESVRAILDNRKSQTRRVVKPQPVVCPCNPIYLDWKDMTLSPDAAMTRYCPYGKPGDVLYVKEPFLQRGWHENDPELAGCGKWIWDDMTPETIKVGITGVVGSYSKWRKRSPLFMPAWASRLKIVLTDVRVERLQDITEEDAYAEGVEPLFSHAEIHEPRYRSEFDLNPMPFKNYLWHGDFGRNGMGNSKSDAWEYQYSSYKDAKGSYSSLWEKINGPGSWESNPFVWVLSFKRYEEEEG